MLTNAFFKMWMIILLCVLFFSFYLIIDNTHAQSDIIKIIPTDDAYVIADLNDKIDVSGLKQTNSGSDELINMISAWNITENQSTVVSVAYLKFDLSEYETESIQTATLYMFAKDVVLDNSPKNIALIFVDDDNWNESEITYLQRPFFSTTIDAISVISEPNKWYSWDITEVIKKNKDSEISLALTFETGKDFTSDLVTFYSKESNITENVPYLEIKYSDQQPTGYIQYIIIGMIIVGVIVFVVLKYLRRAKG